MNARMWVAVAGVSVLMMVATVAGAAWLSAGSPPWIAGRDSGYDPPQTMVLVSDGGMTLRFGYIACVSYDAPQVIERPDSVTLRVYWRGPGGCAPPGDSVELAPLTFNSQVHLASPLGSRRLVGPSGEALPRLDQAAMLAFSMPLAPRQHPNPQFVPLQSSSPMPGWELLVPGARCLRTQDDLLTHGLLNPDGPERPLLQQCAYGGTRSAMPPAGMPVMVRGRAGHLLEGGPHAAPTLVRYGDPWRALWWTQNGTIVILVTESTLPRSPPPLPAASLVALANSLSCQQPAACR